MPLHLYAVAAQPLPDAGAGHWGEPLVWIPAGAVAALAGRVPAHAEPDLDAVLGHDAVVRRVASRGPALPARWQAAFPDGAAIAGLIAPLAGALLEALAVVAERVQMDTVIEGAAAPPPDLAGLGPGARHLSERAAAARACDRALAAVREAVGALALAERAGRTGTAARLHHLVRPGDAAAYRAAIGAVRLEPGLRARASGPWPAYAFAPEELA